MGEASLAGDVDDEEALFALEDVEVDKLAEDVGSLEGK